MEREEKGRERKKEKQELLRVKLKREEILVVGKKGNNSTPSPTWRFSLIQNDDDFPSKTTTLSARKLGANLWEIQPHFNLINMKPHHHRIENVELAHEPHHSSSDKPTYEDSLKSRFKESRKQHRHSSERNGRTLQPSSPASYSSSMEMPPYNPATTRTSSPKLKGRFENSSYSLKTSSELLKVLNRIWSLEEQNASNTSLVAALKKELDYSQTQIKELQEEKERDQEEIDHLKKKKSKEQDQIKHVIRSVKNELEDERKLRKHSESLHRKLARELSEINSSFSDALKEIERERSARILLEELCDEFAKGIKDYEQEVRSLGKMKKIDPIDNEHSDKLILHLSEAWIDGRMQMKQAELHNDLAEKKSIIEKLSCEIDTFLRAKRTGISRDNDLPRSKEQQERMSQDKNRRNHLHGDLLRSKSVPTIGKQIRHENISVEDTFDPSKFTGPVSPVLKWTSTVTAPEPEISGASFRKHQKENTLRAKLLEARLESKSRTSKGISQANQAKS